MLVNNSVTAENAKINKNRTTVTKEEREALTQQQNEINTELDRLNTLNGKISSGDYIENR